MAGNAVTITFAGDSKSLERTFSNVGAGAKGMASDMDKAGADVKKFGAGIDNMNDKVGNSEGKFMGTADLLDGLGGAFGLPLEGATGMARSFADLAGGLSSVVGPAIGKLAGMLGIQTTATAAQATATTGAATAQTGLNTALLANPIGLVIAGLVALAAGLVLAWKHSETFRDVVRGAFETVKSIAAGTVDWIKRNWDLLLPILLGPVGAAITIWRRFGDEIKAAVSTIGGIIVAPFRWAFNEIAKLWNSTVGKLSFNVPSWVPGLGGKGFSMPNLPTFHQGGVVPGNPGQATPIMAMAGERVTPAGGGGGGDLIIQAGAIITESQLADLVQKVLLRKQGRSGSLGFI